jgi:RNA polymerase sigma-70 factor, ECF subfamily
MGLSSHFNSARPLYATFYCIFNCTRVECQTEQSEMDLRAEVGVAGWHIESGAQRAVLILASPFLGTNLWVPVSVQLSRPKVRLAGWVRNWYLRCVMDTVRSIGLAVDRDQALAPYSQEAALVAELQAGSEAAFTYLLAVYQNPVFNLIAHILGNDADAADVLQDVFMKVFKGVRQFHGDSSLKTWIYRIAVHEASNHRRSWLRRRLREVFSLDGGSPGTVVSAGERHGSGDTPYHILEQSERQEWVKRAVASLAEPYKTVVVLREIEDMSYEEIAALLGIAEGTVKSRLMRGRELLRRKLAGVWGR